MTDLLSTGEDGIHSIIFRMVPPGEGSNAASEYALSGLTNYVKETGDETARQLLVQTYLQALTSELDKDAKAFLIRQLELIGKEESVSTLKRLLKDDYLGNPARQALIAIGALKEKPAKAYESSKAIIKLQEQMQKKPVNATKLLMKALESDDRPYRNAALNVASAYADEAMYRKLVSDMQTMTPAAITDLSWWLVRQAESSTDARNTITHAGVMRKMLSLPESTTKHIEPEAMTDFFVCFADDNQLKAMAQLPSFASDNTRLSVARILSQRKHPEALPYISKQLSDATPQLKASIYPLLKEMVTVETLPDLFALYDGASGEDKKELQKSIAEAVAQFSPDTQIAAYTKALEQGAAADRPFYQAQLNAVQAEQERIAFNAMTGENRRLAIAEKLIGANVDEQNRLLDQLSNTGSFLGMTLAASYMDQPATQDKAAQAVMKIALGNPSFTGSLVRDMLTKAAASLTNADAGYQREAINKHLAEMPEGEGYLSLFNGEDLTGWKGLVENPLARSGMKPAELAKAQKKADEEMHRNWKTEDGAIVYYGSGYDNLCTEKDYGDFELFLDWRLDPDGHEPDGGIYLRGTPQVQIWDIARTNVGAQVGSGGLYNNQKHRSTPLQVADNPLGEWNTFYIKMVGDRVTVKLNGELVVDNVMMENYWDRSLPLPVRDQIELQAHGCRVYYKNIYVRELPAVEPFRLSKQEEQEGFKILFDGTNMHHWQGNTEDYILSEGEISLLPSSRFGGNLYTKEEYGNFVFRFEFQLTPGANNGVGIRTPMNVDAAYEGMEIQILDHDAPIYNGIAAYQVHGSVYGIIPAERKGMKPIGEWNYQEIIADGDHIKVTLNGVVILDGNIREATENGTLDKQKHPGLFNEKGFIGFLGHGSKVKFRNIRIKELH